MKVKYILGLIIVAIAGLAVWAMLNMVGNQDVKKITFQFAITGSKKNALKEPNFIVSDQKGNLYVSDSGNARIAVFSKKGKFLYHIDGIESDKRMEYPLGLGILNDTVVVADSRAGVINQYTLKGKFLKTWQADTKIKPAGVYVAPDNQVYITDTAGKQLLVYSDKGLLKQKIISEEVDLGSPVGVSLDKEGDIWIADSSNYNIKVLSQNGKLKDIFDGGPERPLNMAKGLAIDEENRVYVSDTLSGNVRIFDRYGNGIASFGANNDERKLQFPVGVYVDKNRIYVVEQGSNQVQVWNWD